MNFKAAAVVVAIVSCMTPIYSHANDMSTDSTKEYVGDAAITAKVKASFAGDKLVKGRQISVRTDHGVVDLTGTVNSKDESDRATKLAANVESVKAVHNNLKVVSNG